MGSNKTYKHLNSKGNHQENKEATYGMGEDIFSEAIDKGLISKL